MTNTGDEDAERHDGGRLLVGQPLELLRRMFSPGEEESHDFTYTVTANSPDPVPNEVTASGTGATSTDVVTDTASSSTDILNPHI